MFFFEKKNFFDPAGAFIGSAFNRPHRWRLKALPMNAPAGPKIFFQKK